MSGKNCHLEGPIQLYGSSAETPLLIPESRKFLLILATPKKGVVAYCLVEKEQTLIRQNSALRATPDKKATTTAVHCPMPMCQNFAPREHGMGGQ